MYQTKVEFVDSIGSIACEAFGLFVILEWGLTDHLTTVAENPNARMMIGVGFPEEKKRIIKYIPTHKEVHDKLYNNREVIFERYISVIVQKWYDFLAKIYKNALVSNIEGNTQYSIPSEKLKIDLSKKSNLILENVIESAVKNYDFLNSDEKLSVIKKTFNVDNARWDASRNDLDVIKENVLIRNIFQHNHGIIKAEDLQHLGKEYFEEDYGDSKKKKTVGMKIIRTPFDIENCVDSMIRAANMII